MPGSWELKEQNKVLCAFLHTDLVSTAWALGLRNLIIPGPLVPLSGMPYDHARNQAVEACLSGGFEYLFFIDSDVIPPRDAVLRLLNHRLPIVSGLYCRRSPPHSVPVCIKNGSWYTDFPLGAMIEVDLVGAGCLLIHRTVFEHVLGPRANLGKKWFDWRVDTQTLSPPSDQPPLSEDFTWCDLVRKHGYHIMIDSSIQCRHVGLAQSTFGQFLPCEATPNT